MLKKMKLNNKLGFSLVEAMVGMGLMTAVGVGVMQMQSQQVKSQKNIDADYEIRVLSSAIYNQLKNKDSCEETFAGMDLAHDEKPLNEIKNEAGAVVFKSTAANGGTPELFKGQNQIEIVQYIVDPINFVDSDDGITREGSVRFGVEYRKAHDMLNNNNVYRKYLSLPIRVKYLIAGGAFESCITATDDMITTAAQKFCESINGVYNLTDERCVLKNQSYPLTGSLDHDGVSVNGFVNGVWPNLIEPVYVKPDKATTMEGHLIATQNISLERDPVDALDAVPKSYADSRLRCSGNMVGVMTETGVRCENLLCNNSLGASQQYFAGINADGSAICNSLFSDNESCGEKKGRLVAQANGSVKFECCEAVCSNESDHCSSTQYPSDNGCGLCTGTKSAVNASWSAWSDTGETRDISACVAGQIQTEKKQTRTCNGTPECGGANCSGSNEQWVAGLPKTCTVSVYAWCSHPPPSPGTCACYNETLGEYASVSECNDNNAINKCPSYCGGGSPPREDLCVKPANPNAANICAGHCIQGTDSCGNRYVVVGTAPAMSPCLSHAMGPGIGCDLPPQEPPQTECDQFLDGKSNEYGCCENSQPPTMTQSMDCYRMTTFGDQPTRSGWYCPAPNVEGVDSCERNY